MALTDESNGNGFYMPVAPAYGGGGFGNGGFGGDWGWIILLLLCGWGNGGWGMGGFGGGQLGYDFPWLLNGQNQIQASTADGFRSAQLSDGITSIRDGISGLSTQLCGCCGDLQMALANGFSGVEQGANARQMANMQTAFAGQTAMAQGFTGVNSGIADLRYTVATEACADRAAVTAGVQSVLDKLCQLEIDGVRRELAAEQRENANLRSDLMYARGQASQVERTAQLRTAGATIANQAIQELRSCPIPAQPVYGNQPIFQCSGPAWNNNGCGCGCGGNASF